MGEGTSGRPRALWRRPQAWLAAFALCVVLVVLSVTFVDRAVSRFSHDHIGGGPILFDLQSPPNFLMPLGLLAIVVLGLSRIFERTPHRAETVAFYAALALVLASEIVEHVKYIFGRAWPETFVHNNPSYIGDGTYGFFWFHGSSSFASFPSGHTTVITAFAVVIGCAYPRLRWLCALSILCVVAGLIGMDYHFVGDMIAGFFLGGAVGVGTAGLAGLMDKGR